MSARPDLATPPTPAKPATPLGGLHAKGLHLAYGAQPVLSNVDFLMQPGQLGVILGPNGAGKSTLLGVLGGLQAPQSGTVALGGQYLTPHNTAWHARHRAFLPQDETPAFNFTAREIVELGRYPHRHHPLPDEAETVRAAMQATAVAHLASRRIRTLSGGERARVQIARALAQTAGSGLEETPVPARWLLMDEPTAALDLQHQHAVLAMLRRVAHREGVGVLLVLHDLNLALRYADLVWVVGSGRVLAHGVPAQVLTPALVAAVWQVQAQAVTDGSGTCQLLWQGTMAACAHAERQL
ncbi:MAG: heme ABC transporter ATP-binding protein [Serpentinimonas sp.]|nr:heme ABC transporter ATP-binding protein [Serpentinimonas sp.]